MTRSASKQINGVTYRLFTSREFRSLGGDLYIWAGDDGTNDYLTPEEEIKFGVKAYHGVLVNPRR